MSDPHGMFLISTKKGKIMSLDFEHAWLDIYFMLEDNAFDQSKVFHSNDGSVWIGKSQFVEVPF
jgi:hypothetical protein